MNKSRRLRKFRKKNYNKSKRRTRSGMKRRTKRIRRMRRVGRTRRNIRKIKNRSKEGGATQRRLGIHDSGMEHVVKTRSPQQRANLANAAGVAATSPVAVLKKIVNVRGVALGAKTFNDLLENLQKLWSNQATAQLEQDKELQALAVPKSLMPTYTIIQNFLNNFTGSKYTEGDAFGDKDDKLTWLQVHPDVRKGVREKLQDLKSKFKVAHHDLYNKITGVVASTDAETKEEYRRTILPPRGPGDKPEGAYGPVANLWAQRRTSLPLQLITDEPALFLFLFALYKQELDI